MMLDLVKPAPKAVDAAMARNQLGNSGPCLPLTDPFENQADTGAAGEHVAELGAQIGAVVLIGGDMIDVADVDVRFAQAIFDRAAGKARPMLDAAEALLFCRGDQLSIAHQRGRGIAVESVNAENDH